MRFPAADLKQIRSHRKLVRIILTKERKRKEKIRISLCITCICCFFFFFFFFCYCFFLVFWFFVFLTFFCFVLSSASGALGATCFENSDEIWRTPIKRLLSCEKKENGPKEKKKKVTSLCRNEKPIRKWSFFFLKKTILFSLLLVFLNCVCFHLCCLACRRCGIVLVHRHRSTNRRRRRSRPARSNYAKILRSGKAKNTRKRNRRRETGWSYDEWWRHCVLIMVARGLTGGEFGGDDLGLATWCIRTPGKASLGAELDGATDAPLATLAGSLAAIAAAVEASVADLTCFSFFLSLSFSFSTAFRSRWLSFFSTDIEGGDSVFCSILRPAESSRW